MGKVVQVAQDAYYLKMMANGIFMMIYPFSIALQITTRR